MFEYLIYGFIALVVGVCLYFFITGAGKGAPRTKAQLHQAIFHLIDIGTHHSVLTINRHKSKQFLQLRLICKKSEEKRVEILLPRVEWTEPYYSDCIALMQAKRIPVDRTIPQENLEVAIIDVGNNLLDIRDVVIDIWEDIFGADERTIYGVTLDNVNFANNTEYLRAMGLLKKRK